MQNARTFSVLDKALNLNIYIRIPTVLTRKGLKKPIVDRVKNDRPRMSVIGLYVLNTMHYTYSLYLGHLQSW